MRESLKELIKKTIVFEYNLPNLEKGISKTIFSTDVDKCYSSYDEEGFKEIIYNSIIEYSFNEFELTNIDYQKVFSQALKSKIKYDEAAKDETKIKYGFFGEVVLYSILHILQGAMPLIARGYFYNPLENSETKGYDSYHLMERNGITELWFGETKFHKNYKNGIDDVVKKIDNALSNHYLDKNIVAIISNHKRNLNVQNSNIEKIIIEWEENPDIIITEHLRKYNMKLVYPILILYEGKDDYDESIRQIPKYIEETFEQKSFDLSIDYSIFFILLPLKNVKQIKEDVISWIESKKALLL